MCGSTPPKSLRKAIFYKCVNYLLNNVNILMFSSLLLIYCGLCIITLSEVHVCVCLHVR